MINFNEKLHDDNALLSIHNRGFNYGDALFETIKVSYGKLLFWEDHYFRLMASMRIMRMDIPMDFTMRFLENQIKQLLQANDLFEVSSRVKLMVYRHEGGYYLPKTNSVGFVITASPLEDDFYVLKKNDYEVDLFKDFYVSPSLLSTLKTNNKAINVIGSVFANDNKLQNCLLLNTNKQIVEALNGNVFMVKGHTIKTPPLTDGCLKGIMRKQLIEIIRGLTDYKFLEESVSPFELQKADEIWVTNVIMGIIPVTKYRKKLFETNVANTLMQKLNVTMRLS